MSLQNNNANSVKRKDKSLHPSTMKHQSTSYADERLLSADWLSRLPLVQGTVKTKANTTKTRRVNHIYKQKNKRGYEHKSKFVNPTLIDLPMGIDNTESSACPVPRYETKKTQRNTFFQIRTKRKDRLNH